jgi:hypothetical protein
MKMPNGEIGKDYIEADVAGGSVRIYGGCMTWMDGDMVAVKPHWDMLASVERLSNCKTVKLEKLYSERAELRDELKAAKAEQCPHDYGLLKQMEATFRAESAENVRLRAELEQSNRDCENLQKENERLRKEFASNKRTVGGCHQPVTSDLDDNDPPKGEE